MNKIEKLGPIFVLCAAIGAAGCESDIDKARKPALVHDIVENSLEKCDLSSEFAEEAKYTNILKKTLSDVWSEDLDFYLKYNVTICLDERLSSLEQGFFDSSAYGMFYPGSNPVVSLWYDGEEESGYSDSLLEKLVSFYKEEPYKFNQDIVKIGYQTSCGKSCITYKWKDADDFNVVKKNPEIKVSPLNKTPSY